jgi:hypothetical protein
VTKRSGRETLGGRPGDGRPSRSGLRTILYCALIIFFASFSTAIVFTPVDLADTMKKYGGVIVGCSSPWAWPWTPSGRWSRTCAAGGGHFIRTQGGTT